MYSFEHLDQRFEKLNQYESAVSAGLFDRIIEKRKRRNAVVVFFKDHYKLLSLLALVSTLGFTYFYNNIESKNPTPSPSNSILPVVENNNEKNSKFESETIKVEKASTKIETTNSSITKKIEVKKPNFKTDFVLENKFNEIPITANVDVPNVKEDLIATDEIENAENIVSETPNSTITPSRNLFILEKLHAPISPIDFKFEPKLALGGNDRCPTFSKSTDKTWYVDAWVSPDYALRSLKSRTANQESQALADLRNKYEKYQFAASGGLKASLVMKSGISLRLGFMYSHIWEYFNYNNPNEIRVRRDTTIRTIVIAPGDTQFIQVVNVRTLTGQRIVQHNNYYRMYDIPLQVGYEFGRDKNMRYSVNLGMNINISTSYRGKTLDENFRPVEFTTGATSGVNDIYQNSVGLSFYGSFAMYKRINERWQYVIEPNVRHMLGSLSKDTYDLSHSYTTFGLNLGLRYKIN